MAAVISPWNFPLAICAGMTAAALVDGNTAMVKPSEQTRGIARLMCEILWQSGVPPRCSISCRARAATVGDGAGPRPPRGDHRLHRLEGGGIDILAPPAQTPEGQPLREKSRLRDGRQECDDRR